MTEHTLQMCASQSYKLHREKKDKIFMLKILMPPSGLISIIYFYKKKDYFLQGGLDFDFLDYVTEK